MLYPIELRGQLSQAMNATRLAANQSFQNPTDDVKRHPKCTSADSANHQ